MASNTHWLCMSRLRDTYIAQGHAVPFELMSFEPTEGVLGAVCLEHIGFGAQGVSVPISRGSPPTCT